MFSVGCFVVAKPIGCSDLSVYFLTVSSLNRYNTLVHLVLVVVEGIARLPEYDE